MPEKTMTTYNYTLRFLTPAFLGGADQSGQWRTPPIKHLLREWWRVAWCRRNGFRDDVNAMRRAEGALFGMAADDQQGGSLRSRVVLRLGEWRPGDRKQWVGKDEPRVFHPHVGHGGMKVGAHLYLGYGPLQYEKSSHQTELAHPPAINAGETVELRIAFPEAARDELNEALWLAHRFGTLGGRARNGWGSFVFDGLEIAAPTLPLRDWRQCLDREYPHAIGRDDQGPLIWQTEPCPDWSPLEAKLAEIKIAFRTHLGFRTGRNASHPELRHWLAYPVTNHSVQGWGNYRLPNSLRFRARETDGGLVGILYHMPIWPPEGKAGPRERPDIEEAWRRVHRVLDKRLTRVKA